MRALEFSACILELDPRERADALQLVLVEDVCTWMASGDASFDPENKIASIAWVEMRGLAYHDTQEIKLLIVLRHHLRSPHFSLCSGHVTMCSRLVHIDRVHYDTAR